ncbi:MAG: lactate racemase domain-containing protein [Chloroflexota bacterium]
MAAKKVRLRVGAWFLEQDIEIVFPDNWDVQECRMAGHDRPALGDEAMRAAVQNPIGSPCLSELARGKEKVVIIFDDLPKPTPVSRIAPFVLEELQAAGIADSQIRFICAPGTHRPLIYPEFVAKLGKEIVDRFPVFNHTIWENVVHVGTTSHGTEVRVNREFAACDLRIGIGSLIPHGLAGFGGGGKLVLPGVAGIDTIDSHHVKMAKSDDLSGQRGELEGNRFRLDIEEAARLAGLHFKVDAVLNNKREVVGLFAGDFVAEHRVASKLATEVYYTEPIMGADVVVVNAYPDEPQFVRSTWAVDLSVREGGDAVLINHSHEGQNLHQWGGRFGTDYGGRGWKPGRRAQHLDKPARLMVLSPHLSMYDRQELGAMEKVSHYTEWSEVLAELASRHGPGTKVVVYPYAPIQLVKK